MTVTVTNKNVPISEPKSTGLIDAGKATDIDMVDVLTAALSRTTITAKRPPVAQGRNYFPISEDQILKDLEELNNNNNNNINTRGWVDSMRASSPTHIRSILSSADMGNHPSALDMFEQIITASKGKQIVMFLDYDGTLSPIVDDPDRAFMSEAMRTTVRKVARYFPTAIVSGRCRDKVYNFVRLAELFYAGSHGMDIMGPAKKGSNHLKGVNINHQEAVLFQPAGDLLPMIDQVHNTLIERIKSIPGVKIEDNKFCLSVHFRCVDEKKWSELAHEVRSVLKDYPKLRLTQGRKVLEIRPSIKWDKGKALEFLLESLGLGNCTNVFPVYIGDDRTDEDAFKVLRDRGQGFGILVSKIPKETNASYYLQEPAEVMDFLQRLVKWKRLSMRRQFRL